MWWSAGSAKLSSLIFVINILGFFHLKSCSSASVSKQLEPEMEKVHIFFMKHYNHGMFLVDNSERSPELYKSPLQRDHWFWILKIGRSLLQPSNYTVCWTPDEVLHIQFSSLKKKYNTNKINISQYILYRKSWQTKVYVLNFAFHLF